MNWLSGNGRAGLDIFSPCSGGAWSGAVCGACAVWVLLHQLFGMKLTFGGMSMCCAAGFMAFGVWGHVFNICVLVGAGPVRKFMLGFIWGWVVHGDEIRIHWGVGTVSTCGSSGWWVSLDPLL
ncbi:hypothetical protein ILYODFUR_033932 [Ilyodon furcidens]|uniref:Transmembrane protein n=1 Tax=Ilyodon furcidens TaxID=33524 RepID=A0ABV0TP31_9TELE